MEVRQENLRKQILAWGLDCVIVNKPENLRYFGGFTGSAGLALITAEKKLLLTDFRYIEQASKQAAGFEIVRYLTTPYELIGQVLKELRVRKIGFESDFISFDIHSNISNVLEAGQELIPQKLDMLRQCKDRYELEQIAEAVRIADKGFNYILSKIKPGVREIDIAIDLEFYMRTQGSEKEAFGTIVASGWRGALPHGLASEKKIETGELVTLDFGAVYNGYHSDITRTVAVGKADQKQKEVYRLVLEAQKAGCAAIKPGIIAKDIDGVSRKIITDAGYGEYFGHGLGHGVCLVIHEEPRLNQTGNTILTENMVVTVEPGIYLPGWGGVRIEDTVRIGVQAVDIFTASNKELIELM